jgi:hypothetical protein
MSQPEDPPVGRPSRGALVFVGHLIVVVMAVASMRAENRLAAFGLTCYTASGLLAGPRLLAGAAQATPLDNWLRSRPVRAIGRFHDEHRHVIGALGYLQLVLLVGGLILSYWHSILGWAIVISGMALTVYIYLSNTIFWATWRSSPLPDGSRLDLVDIHLRGLKRRLGPDAVWALAGLFFFAGTILQFLDAMGL